MIYTFISYVNSLAAEDPLNSKSPRNIILGYLDVVFTTIFTFEITVKVSIIKLRYFIYLDKLECTI